MNSTSAPDIDNGLICKRLDVCLQYFFNDGGTDICWSQWEVILVSDGTNIPTNQSRQSCYKVGKAGNDFKIR